MTAPRLPFLYPQLFRSLKPYEPAVRPFRFSAPPSNSFHSSRRCEQNTFPSRRGQAVEPKLPPPSRPKNKPAKSSGIKTAKKDVSSTAQSKSTPHPELVSNITDYGPEKSANSKEKIDGKQEVTEEDSDSSKATLPTSKQDDNSPSQTKDAEEVPPPQNPLDAVLQMPQPEDMSLTRISEKKQGIPHLRPAHYVHHFDTYTLVKDLQAGGFSEEQAITVMKAIRGILQDKLDLAEDTLTSKSDSENEEYLFEAACSELRSSLQASRNLEIERQRASRTQLQHDADILNLRLNQELTRLNDDLKGMRNDHKMTIREQQRSLDTGIQELNYRIAVSLASDGKSEAEGLRWVLTRRAALAIAFSALMAIAFFKFYSVYTHDLQKKQAAAKSAATAEPVHDAAIQTQSSLSDALASESLG
ncbi:hypothetical protein BGW36DRAFT_428985 [Talaromyces proteolyticus]|uniref:MOZ protein represents a chromatin-associated acetyltransferase n=1 Tax=Talaromyces proteolyticus TaxID=1131652 RepID=A0AAD4PYV6_9EURO|nr:uncharacterized protein BGW36DRAFT_428985 [Talaromyces proteolyticus]KAH8695097.1 hypothetical protein BGW36DRAFT_428985 [Talaromyces proteolyticus]